MNGALRYQAFGYAVSFLVHATGIFLLLAFCTFIPLQTKTLSIDFTTFSVPKKAPVQAKADLTAQRTAVPAAPKPVVQQKRRVAKIHPAKRKVVVIKEATPEEVVEPVQPVAEPEPVAEAAESAPTAVEPEPETLATASMETSPSADIVSSGPTAADGLPTAAGAATGQPSGREQYVKAHFLYIQEGIQKGITYPQIARKMGWEGKVVISFVICENGQVENIRVIRSSGYKVLDSNAVNTVRRVAPFPRPPVRAELIVPISYRLS
jgi:protein TonB